MGPENRNEYTVYWDGVPLGNTPIVFRAEPDFYKFDPKRG
jgi:hypothetical protein